MSVDWLTLAKSLEKTREVEKKESDWSALKRLGDEARNVYEEEVARAEKESLRTLKLPEEIELHVNQELFDQFALRAMEMAVVGRNSYTEKTTAYWKNSQVKRLSYYGPTLTSYPKFGGGEATTTEFMEYPTLDMGSRIGTSHHAKYQVVASPYTIQHYFKTESMAKCFIENVYNLLAEGGIFLCMFYNGSVIVDLIEKRGGTLGIYHSDDFSIERGWKGVGRFFGSSYTMITSGGATGDSYLVFTNVLLELARKVGLIPIKAMPDEAMLYMNENENKKYPTFYYDFYGSHGSERENKLKNVVVFKKPVKV
jgi:hypothetical protein